MKQHVEHVARALHDAEGNAQAWDREPDIIREEFRLYAQIAVALLAQHRQNDMDEFARLELESAA